MVGFKGIYECSNTLNCVTYLYLDVRMYVEPYLFGNNITRNIYVVVYTQRREQQQQKKKKQEKSVGTFIFIACNAMKGNKDQDRIRSSYVPLDYYALFVYVVIPLLSHPFFGYNNIVPFSDALRFVFHHSRRFSHTRVQRLVYAQPWLGVLFELPSGTRYAQKLCVTNVFSRIHFL